MRLASAAISEALGYDAAGLAAIPEGADLGLGGGNPLAVLGLAPGETVAEHAHTDRASLEEAASRFASIRVSAVKPARSPASQVGDGVRLALRESPSSWVRRCRWG